MRSILGLLPIYPLVFLVLGFGLGVFVNKMLSRITAKANSKPVNKRETRLPTAKDVLDSFKCPASDEVDETQIKAIMKPMVEENLAIGRMEAYEFENIYRTARALSTYLDDLENRPQMLRLLSIHSTNASSLRLMNGHDIPPPFEVHIKEIELQERIGEGAYGAVYRGTWRDAVVAIKHVVCNIQDAKSLERSIREVVLSKKMSHPNVVQTYAWTLLLGENENSIDEMVDLNKKLMDPVNVHINYGCSIREQEYSNLQSNTVCINTNDDASLKKWVSADSINFKDGLEIAAYNKPDKCKSGNNMSELSDKAIDMRPNSNTCHNNDSILNTTLQTNVDRISSDANTPQTNNSKKLRLKSPDSFNRYAPGTCFFDDTEATQTSPIANEITEQNFARTRRRLDFINQMSVSNNCDEGCSGGTDLVSHGHNAAANIDVENKKFGESNATQVLQIVASSAFNNLTEERKANASDLSNIDVDDGATHSESECSCDSFNSEEGFGSPKTGPKKNKVTSQTNVLQKIKTKDSEKNEAIIVVVMEFCDLQSLHRAISKRVFKPHGKFSEQTTYRAMLRTAQEIAKGMEYIHNYGVIHGDLKPANVLLKTHKIDRRGYIAKISDFGLSRSVQICHSAVGEVGTVHYTAPETFLKDKVNRASDVYAFGILLWEMYHCEEAYKDLFEGQICLGVSDGSLRPEFDPSCPEDLKSLTEQCWSQNPIDRPTFKFIAQKLIDIETAYRINCHKRKPIPDQ